MTIDLLRGPEAGPAGAMIAIEVAFLHHRFAAAGGHGQRFQASLPSPAKLSRDVRIRRPSPPPTVATAGQCSPEA